MTSMTCRVLSVIKLNENLSGHICDDVGFELSREFARTSSRLGVL